MVGLVDSQGATNALAGGYNFMRGITQDRARREAGNALASGDINAAMSALGGAGDLQSVQALQQGQQQQSQAQMEQEQEERARRLEFIGQAAEAIYRAPAAERDAVWSQLRPVFQQMGFPDDLLMQMDRAPKSDANLRAVITASGREVASPFANDITIGASRVRPNPETGQYEPVYTDMFETEYRQAQIAAQNALVGQRQAAGAAALARANRTGGGGRPRGGGDAAPSGGSRPSSAVGALPPGFRIRR
jgi:hypothetical protein